MEIISCKNLTFTYPKSKNPVFANLNLGIEQGSMTVIIGKSAVGKSTLLRLMKKEIAPFGKLEGSVAAGGTVGFVAQDVYESVVSDTVDGELSFGLVNMGMDSRKIGLTVAETASYFNLSSKLGEPVSALSGGEVQMLNLASVMAMRPDVLLLDEPTSQLDPVSAQRFFAMVQRLHRDFSTTVIMTEHNLELIYDDCTDVVVMDGDGVKKLAPDSAASYLFQKNSPLLDMIPIRYRLFDGAKTVLECRNKLSEKKLSLPAENKKMPRAAMKIKGLCFAYKKGEDVLFNLSLDVAKGCINAVVGPNSSGKSTLLFAASGAKKPYRGRVKADGKIAMLCQNVRDLFTRDTCAEEVAFGKTTELLGISDIADCHPYDISGGQAQRLAIAKVLEKNADIILLDEPTRGLDPIAKKELGSILRSLCSSGKTILLVTHDIEFAGEYADWASFLSGGAIAATMPRRSFFSSLGFYTTALARITDGIADGIVSAADLEKAGETH